MYMSKTYYFYKIYKDEFCYIGSTCNLYNRESQHKSACNNENDNEHNRKVYKTIRANGGWNCFTFELIKQFDNLTKQEAQVIEQVYISEFEPNMNMVRSHRTRQQHLEDDRQYCKKYRLNNPDIIKERRKQYYLNNRDKCLEREKQNRLNNRDKINEIKREKVTCECGCIISRTHLAGHKKTAKHQDYRVNTLV